MVLERNVKNHQPCFGKGTITIRTYKAGTKILLSESVQRNLIMVGTNTGINLIIRRLLSINTYTLNINWGAIGTNGTAVAASDTQLGTETLRTTVALASQGALNLASFQFFFPDANLANGTYREFGMFIDGTATANSGQIFNHALFTTPYVKAGGTDTTVQCDIEFFQ